jgi:hypothetical protein
VAETGEQLAYEAAVGALDRQAVALDGLRARAGTLVAASALVASLLGAPAIENDASTYAVAVGVVAFLMVLVLAIAILWPYHMVFRMSPTTLLRNSAKGFSYASMQRLTARALEAHHGKNENTLRILNACLAVGCVFVVLELSIGRLGR